MSLLLTSTLYELLIILKLEFSQSKSSISIHSITGSQVSHEKVKKNRDTIQKRTASSIVWWWRPKNIGGIKFSLNTNPLCIPFSLYLDAPHFGNAG